MSSAPAIDETRIPRFYDVSSSVSAIKPTSARPDTPPASEISSTNDCEDVDDMGGRVVHTQLPHPLLLPNSRPTKDTDQSKTHRDVATSKSFGAPIAQTEGGHMCALSTAYLTPQTLKVAKGQVTVLPSLSVLVDLREGERRSGRKGVEVLRVTSDGQKIEVHSAPHLSTPCCLAEPTATFSLDQLPLPYQKQYRDACEILDQLKQRVPKVYMVIRSAFPRYMLMANEPAGDIEVVAPPPLQRKQSAKGKERELSTSRVETRVRYSRQSKTVEISRSAEGSALTGLAGEWTRKIFRVASENSHHLELVQADVSALAQPDQALLRLLTQFLPVCDTVANFSSLSPTIAAEEHSPGRLSPAPVHPGTARVKILAPLATPTVDDTQQSARLPSSSDETTCISTAAATGSNTTLLSQLDLAPRPARLPLAPSATCSEDLAKRPLRFRLKIPTHLPKESVRRFSPGIGWTSYDASTEQSPQIVTLFLDGASLVVNIGERHLEFIDAYGTSSKYLDGEWCDVPGVAEMMRMFETAVDSLVSAVL
ncbi:hypothetical protein EIP91_001122 [Steccherinum ochraceum]|uniref:Cryptic POLO box 1 (CPB1) domain-containing protein n=1 Tax=Steccherinum ochraceum TaxID=92696 RepID=A0A4R0RHL2_9APHY|nr:hypothetical protein EIP91_001122 [Steccherinum ochraceum]